MPNSLGQITPLISDFTFGELSPEMIGRPDSPVYHRGAITMQNFVPRLTGGFRKRAGTLQIGKTYGDLTPRLQSLVISGSLWYLLEFTNNLLRVWKNGTTLLGTTYVTTYTTEELPALQFGWAYPSLFIAHQNHPPARLTYSGSDTFIFGDITIIGSSPQYYAGTTSTDSKTITGVTPDPTTDFFLTYTGKPISSPFLAPGTKVVSVTTNTIVVDTFPISNGATTVGISQDKDLPFQSASNYPAAVACANQRALWFSTATRPQGVWATIVGIWDDASMMQIQLVEVVVYTVQKMRVNGSGQPLDTNNVVVSAAAANTPAYDDIANTDEIIGDADGFTADIFSDRNDVVQWAVAARDIIIGTLSSHVMMPGDFTANTFSFQHLSKIGCAPIQGIFVSGGVLFIDRAGKRVMRLDWQGTNVEFPPPDTVSLFAEHLFMTDPVVQIAYESSPVPRLWCLRTSGSLVALEIDDQYNVRAWWRFVTDGTVKSITIGQGTSEDTLYMSVLRNGHVTIEALQTKDWASQSGAGGVLPAIYLDCAVYKYNATPFTTVELLGDLEGKTVGMVGDGMYLGTAVVTAGAVTLPTGGAYPASYNTAVVGLPFASEATSMPIELGNMLDSTQARKLSIPHVALTFYKTLDAQIIGVQGGTPEAAVLGGVQGAFPTLFSGIEIVPMPSGFSTGSTITVRSSLPLPCQVTAIVPEVMGYE
jgi:hypothetical protein